MNTKNKITAVSDKPLVGHIWSAGWKRVSVNQAGQMFLWVQSTRRFKIKKCAREIIRPISPSEALEYLTRYKVPTAVFPEKHTQSFSVSFTLLNIFLHVLKMTCFMWFYQSVSNAIITVWSLSWICQSAFLPERNSKCFFCCSSLHFCWKSATKKSSVNNLSTFNTV